ncbi:hypothetical protein [Crateriforma conspicua]|uniref:hypothetical protein n=1 Tax=Crateriforma conspicua TaxID=2527996 RepID=UPI0011B6CF3C|nr:hypothetical protein [Crateriforma conspicua]
MISQHENPFQSPVAALERAPSVGVVQLRSHIITWFVGTFTLSLYMTLNIARELPAWTVHIALALSFSIVLYALISAPIKNSTRFLAFVGWIMAIVGQFLAWGVLFIMLYGLEGTQ